MIVIHKAAERGKSDLGWLKSRFSFSFADYYNPKRMNFGALRVLNDDEIAPSKGFGAHPHEDMEIITLVLAGEIAHKDSTGSNGVTKAGEVQVMSAGSGVVHSEFNNSKTETAKLFQIWIDTKENGIKPRYDQKSFDPKDFHDRFHTVVSGDKPKQKKQDAHGDELYIHQDANIKVGCFSKESKQKLAISKGNGLFLFMQDGTLEIEGKTLNSRDSAEISNKTSVEFQVKKGAKVIAIEVPMIS